MSRLPPRGARGAYYQRQVMAALDCVAMYQRAFGQSPTLTEVAVLMGVSVPHAGARLRDAREAGFITWERGEPRSFRFVKVG